MEAATEAAIDASYYFDMWSSDACWKGDTKVVARSLKKMNSDALRLEALKENIRIRTLGFGWTKDPDFHTNWSLKVGNKQRQKSVKELADHLRYIISEEKEYDIPEVLYVETHQPAFVHILGTRT